jgi:hypothetical protein
MPASRRERAWNSPVGGPLSRLPGPYSDPKMRVKMASCEELRMDRSGGREGVEMGADFFNVYEDKARAQAYADLEFPGTYYLAYRDLPAPWRQVRALSLGQ